MTIATTDIKLRTSERLTDNSDGGGRLTSGIIVDGQLNNLFQDTSRLDRVTGRVSMRKAFMHVDTANVDTLLGAHVILTDPPDDDYTFCCVFATGSPTDERLAAQNRVEAYVIAGPETAFTLYGNHIVGQRLVRITCRASQVSPDQGEVLLLSTEADGYTADQQFVRIESVDSRTTQVFTDASGDYERDVLVCTISAPLRFDFYGLETPPRISSTKAPTRVRVTQVADAARYFSVQPLSEEAAAAALQVKVASPYVPLVPVNEAESSLVDQSPFADVAAMIASGAADQLEASITSAGTAGPDFAVTLYFGTGCYPGSVRITRGSVLLKDNGAGDLVGLTPGQAVDGYGGTVDYQNGAVTLTCTSSWSGTASMTATPAGLFVAPPFSKETRITLGNRGYVYVFSCLPLPNPGTVIVSYRALGRWYTLRDNGAGTLQGASAGQGSGSVNYGTGSVDVTLGALPDVDSSILLSWGTPRQADARFGDVLIEAPIVEHTLEFVPEPNTLSITWLAGGVSKTATANISGVISGDAAGAVNHGTGEVWFRPGKIPDSDTTFTFEYDKQTGDSDIVTASVAGQVISGTIDAGGEIQAGTLTMLIAVENRLDGVVLGTETIPMIDDGAGGWREFRGGPVYGSINYSTGEFAITIGSTYTESVPNYTYQQVVGYGWIVQTFTGYTSVTTSQVPVAGAVTARYRLSSAGSTAHSEEIDGVPLVIDLTPAVRDQVVSGSVRFTYASRTYVDRAGALYYGVLPTNNSGIIGGSFALSSGVATITDYAFGGGDNTVEIDSLLTVRGDAAVNTLFFRIPAQSIKRGALSIRANRIDTGALITGTADINGAITGTGITGEIDAEMGIVRVVFGELVTAAGNESEPWYIAEAVEGGQILRPIAVDPSSIRYNVVTLKSVPVDAEVIGLDPVRLPADGRVPWVRPGNVAVIHHTEVTSVASPAANDVTDLGRTDLTYAYVRDSAGAEVVSAWYVTDLDAGTVTWSDPLDLSAYTLPILIKHRIEDMIRVSDALITGEIFLTRGLSRDYPLGSYLSTALIPIPQDMAAGVANVFAQSTWTNEWADVLIGDEPAAAYNDIAYPFTVDNRGATTGRYRIQFTSATAFTCFLEGVGGIGTGNITTNFAPTNPLTGQPYFTIDADGWGSGWASGNVLRFNVNGASYPIWFARCTLPGPIDEPSDAVRVELRGDAD